MRRSPTFLLALAAILILLSAGATLAAPLPAGGTVPSADGVPIRYHVEGPAKNAGPALVFVHCWSCDRHLWDEQVAHFATSHRVVTLDLAGHGESGQGRKEWTIPAFGQDVASVVRALGLRKVILIGHSMGGPVILEAARALPGRVVGLVPVDTLLDAAKAGDPQQVDAFLAPLRADYKPAIAKFARAAMFVPTTDPKLIEKIIAEMQSRPPAIAIAALAHAFTYDARPALREIKAPIHAINGDKYPTDVEGNRKLAPQYQMTLMKGTGHYLMLEDPKRFDGILEGVIGEMASPATRPAHNSP
jgi:pimeloyl-ACP methyl ester carboxylesterase